MMDGRNAKPGLDRYLSPTDVWALSLGCIIGWGAFVMPGTTFLPVAGPVGTVVAMAISAAVMLVIGFNYFYLMKQYPGTGGVYAYSKETLGRDHAFLSSWFLCLSYLSLIPQNATILAVMCRALWGDALRGGLHYSIAGAEVYLGEVGVAVAALVVIQMPVMDGYAATRAIRALENPRLAGIPIVAMTANAFEEDVRAAEEAGMQGHIAKPIDVAVMVSTLGDVLSGR